MVREPESQSRKKVPARLEGCSGSGLQGLRGPMQERVWRSEGSKEVETEFRALGFGDFTPCDEEVGTGAQRRRFGVLSSRLGVSALSLKNGGILHNLLSLSPSSLVYETRAVVIPDCPAVDPGLRSAPQSACEPQAPQTWIPSEVVHCGNQVISLVVI